MQLRHFPIHPALRPYLALIWVFETDHGIPPSDLRVIAPNAEMKLIIPFRDWLSSTNGGGVRRHEQSTCTIVGQQTRPVVIDGPRVNGTIGITFKPAAAYRFFRFPLGELIDKTLSIDDWLGTKGTELHERVDAATGVARKIEVVQHFLVELLAAHYREERVVDFALGEIERTSGRVAVEAIAQRAGYTRRQLDRKFAEFVGLSPKTVASVIRFQRFYLRELIGGEGADPSELYDFYYDQSHFIRDFKRFAGRPPREVRAIGNTFGRLFVSPRYVPFVQSSSRPRRYYRNHSEAEVFDETHGELD